MAGKIQLLDSPRQIPDWIQAHETRDKYGYDPCFLKLTSQKIVLSKCVVCSMVREQKSQAAQTQSKCLNCSNKINARSSLDLRAERMKAYYAQGGLHPMKGRKHSAESRKKMSDNSKGQVISLFTREALRKANLGRPLSQEHKEKLRKANIGKKLSEEHKRKVSLNHADVSGTKNPSYGKPRTPAKFHFYTSPSAGCLKLRSGWELKVAKWLDANKEIWFYEPCVFPVTFQSGDRSKNGTYCPDFYVKSRDEYWEVKGRWFRDSKAKFESAIKQHSKLKFVLLMRDDLIRKGINV